MFLMLSILQRRDMILYTGKLRRKYHLQSVNGNLQKERSVDTIKKLEW